MQQQLKIPNLGFIAGSKVTEGLIQRNLGARLYRDEELFIEGKIESLKRFKDDVKEVKSNFECGLSIKNFDDLQVNDKLEAYEHVQVARKL